jgi:hypothetical protein
LFSPSFPIPRPYIAPVNGLGALNSTSSGTAAATVTTDSQGEFFDVPQSQGWEPGVSAAEHEKALRDLVESTIVPDGNSNVDMTQAVVEGFKDTFRLLPHQVQGRMWMKDRETGKKCGGILADVSLQLVPFLVILHC